MAYETFPPIKHCKKYGQNSIPSPSSRSTYPKKGMPNSRDDRGAVKLVSQSGNGAGKPGSDYPKGAPSSSKFPELQGLPGGR